MKKFEKKKANKIDKIPRLFLFTYVKWAQTDMTYICFKPNIDIQHTNSWASERNTVHAQNGQCPIVS